MAFSGRSSLLALIDQLIRVNGGPQVTPDTVRPVLVLEGIGGSGRSEVLRHVWRLNAEAAPTAMVDPLAVGQADSMRDVLRAVMLGLTAKVPTYQISFPRVVLAHIAMDGPIDSGDAMKDVWTLRKRIDAYQDRGAVVRLLVPLVTDASAYLKTPGADNLVPAAAEEIVRRLERRRARLAWNDAELWFGHQDQDFRHDPERALVLLSRQAQQGSASVRQDVDHLLIAALLADLRDSLARTVNRQSNAVVLLDNGDAPSAREFVRALNRVRSELRTQGAPPDPLVVVTTSGGLTRFDTAGPTGRTPGWSESAVEHLTAEEIGRPGSFLRVVLDGLTEKDVQQMARGRLWESLGTSVIASTIHRFTGGHAKATDLVLNQLHHEPALIDDLDAVLSRPLIDLDDRLERHVLDSITAGLSPRQHRDKQLRNDLITLAAARHNEEARLLAPLMGDRVNAELVLFTSTTLWSAPGLRGKPAMAPFVRLLLLRELAARDSAHEAGWCEVFKKLRNHARDHDDLSGVLHHGLALGEVESVVRKLFDLLPELPTNQWLALLDGAVATPPLASCGGDPAGAPSATDPAPGAPSAGGRTPGDPLAKVAVSRLVTNLHRLANPLLSNREDLKELYLTVSRSYQQLDDQIQLRFLDRTMRYEALANALA